MRLHELVVTHAILSLLPVAAAAQTPSEPATDVAAIEDIVVTAQYRQENLQKVAIAVDVVSGEDIANAGVKSPTQLTNLVPSLQISQGGASSQSFFIRGVGTLTSNSYSDPGIAFNVDGVYIGRPTSVRNTFYDIERVEVLKGPQGTLYGRNATGGAINVLPAKPKLGETSGALASSYGNYDEFGIDGHVNIPLGELAAARLAGTYNRRDGYSTDGTNDADGYAFRGQVLFEPTDALSFRLTGDYAHDGGNGPGGTITGYINPLTQQRVVDPLPRSAGPRDPRTSALYSSLYSFQAGRFGEGFGDDPFADNNYWGVKGEADADLGFGTLTTIAAYRETKLRSLDYASGFGASTREDDNQTSLEARLAGPDEGLFRWLGGLYYYDENVQSDYQFNLKTLSAFQSLDAGTTAKAAFARITIAPTDRLRFIAGLRYTDEKKRFDGLNTSFLNICSLSPFPPAANCGGTSFFTTAGSPAAMIQQMGLLQVTPPNVLPPVLIQPANPAAANSIFLKIGVPIQQTLKTQKTNFRAAVEYDVAPNNLIYASFENGFHAGGFSFAFRQPSFRPEFIDAYTIGSKNRFADGRIQLNFEAFLWKYRDQQITHFATDVTGALVFVTENAGASTNKGFEIEARVKPARNTTLSLDVQYLHAKYDEFSYDAPNSPTSPPLFTSCPTTPITLFGQPALRADCAGFKALRSPEWTVNFGVEQIVPIGANQVTLAANTRLQSKSVIGFEMLPGLSEQPSYTATSLSADFGPEDGKWSMGIFANNLENERPIGQSFFNNQLDTFASVPGAPRTYGVRARVNF